MLTPQMLYEHGRITLEERDARIAEIERKRMENSFVPNSVADFEREMKRFHRRWDGGNSLDFMENGFEVLFQRRHDGFGGFVFTIIVRKGDTPSDIHHFCSFDEAMDFAVLGKRYGDIIVGRRIFKTAITFQ